MIGIVLETDHPSVWCRTAEKVARCPGQNFPGGDMIAKREKRCFTPILHFIAYYPVLTQQDLHSQLSNLVSRNFKGDGAKCPPPGGTACMGTYSVPSYLSCLGSFAYFMLVLKFDVFFL
jgi:hypothetical protein